MRKLDVCLSLDLYKHYDNDCTVVVVDILRATSVISTAFHYGIKDVIVVSTVNEASKYLSDTNYIVAAERGAMSLEGFEYGNSPFHYMHDKIHDKTLVLTTTNGTKAINLAKHREVITSSYINTDAVCNFILEGKKDVLILCSGWKGMVNMEDSIFAGCLSQRLLNSNLFQTSCDSVLITKELYANSSNDIYDFLKDSSHRKRLNHLDMEKDIRFCLDPDFTSNIVPIYRNDRLISNY